MIRMCEILDCTERALEIADLLSGNNLDQPCKVVAIGWPIALEVRFDNSHNG